jgi:hypothetical protein
MRFSIRNRLFILPLFILSSTCSSTSFYRVHATTRLRGEIIATPDRVLLQCEDVGDFDGKTPSDRAGFSVYVLDDEDSVISFSTGSVQDKKSCLKRVELISKILNSGRRIYIGGFGGLLDSRKIETFSFKFSKSEKLYYGNGRAMQLRVLRNENGGCYDVYTENGSPRPLEEFPIHKDRPIQFY